MSLFNHSQNVNQTHYTNPRLLTKHILILPKLTLGHSQLKGSINDCSCSVDTVDYFNNNKIYPRLRSLLLKDYFRFYKINLYKQCPFWEDDGKCAMRFCSVSPCSDKDIPVGLRELRSEAPHEKVCDFDCNLIMFSD